MRTATSDDPFGATRHTSLSDRDLSVTTDTFLPPIEKPRGLMMKLAYYFTFKQSMNEAKFDALAQYSRIRSRRGLTQIQHSVAAPPRPLRQGRVPAPNQALLAAPRAAGLVGIFNLRVRAGGAARMNAGTA